MTRLILIAVSLLAVSAWGQVDTSTHRPKWSLLWEDIADTCYYFGSDTLHDPAAKFDTLYWRYTKDSTLRFMSGGVSGSYWTYSGLWERRAGRWDTTKLTVCDTVWTTTDQWWQASSVISVGGDTTIYLFRNDGPCENCKLLRTQVGEVRCRERIIVTPKAIRFESGRR